MTYRSLLNLRAIVFVCLGALFTSLAHATPVALWTGEASGNTALEAIGGAHATMFNGTTSAPGLIGNALVFDGVDDYAIIENWTTNPAPQLNVTAGDFSVTAWVQFASLGGRDMSIVDKMQNGNQDGWRLLKQGDNRFWFCLGGGTGVNGCTPTSGNTVRSNTVAVVDEFFHLAAVRSGAELLMYVNGVLEATSVFSSFSNGDSIPVRLGGTASSNTSSYLHGAVDEAAIWNRALTDGEILALANASSVSEPAALGLALVGLAGAGLVRRRRRA